MSDRQNHHYVPEHFFKMFNGGRRCISGFLRRHEKIFFDAPIKGQCSDLDFYGNKEVEQSFSKLEGRHSQALRALVSAADHDDITLFGPDEHMWLLQAVTFQRCRTQLEVEKQSPARNAMLLEAFSRHLQNKLPPADFEKFQQARAAGKTCVTSKPTRDVLQQIHIGLECASLLGDLKICVVRNHTSRPFIFSDSPVVLYNSVLREVTDRGVLGLQSPGLQIFCPLTPKIQLLMMDGGTYTCNLTSRGFCDVATESDIAHLNALQLHHSRSAIYFVGKENADYIEAFYAAHRPNLKKPETEFRIRNDILIDDAPAEDVLHTYEPHLNHRLRLSFLDHHEVDPENYCYRYRSPAMVEAFNRIHSVSL